MSYDIDEFEELMESSRMGGWNMRSLRVCRSLPTSPLSSPKRSPSESELHEKTDHKANRIKNDVNEENTHSTMYPNLLVPPNPHQELQTQANGSAGVVRPKKCQLSTEPDENHLFASGGGMRRTQSCRRPAASKKDNIPFSYRQRAHANAWKRQNANTTSLEDDDADIVSQLPKEPIESYEPEPQAKPANDEDLQDCKIYRLRSFRTTSGGIENRGDSFKVKSKRQSSKRRIPQNLYNRRLSADVKSSTYYGDDAAPRSPIRHQQMHSPCSNEPSPSRPNLLNVQDSSKSDSLALLDNQFQNVISEEENVNIPARRPSGVITVELDFVADQEDVEADVEEEDNNVLKVLVIGTQGVGKSTLTRQLLTSEYLANSERYLDDDREQVKIVSVMLDDEESMVQFVDVRNFEEMKSNQDVDAYIVVYSVTDQNSFAYAQACLQDLTRKGVPSRKKVIIVVANKQDNIRNREVTEHDGRSLASHRNCKYTEVSALLDHKVDELLVGIVRQIRLKQQLLASTKSSGEPRRIGCLQRAALGFFRRLFRKRTTNANCDNLLSP